MWIKKYIKIRMSEYEHFLDIPEKNTTIAAVEYRYFQQQLAVLGNSPFRRHLDEMYSGCFGSPYGDMPFPDDAVPYIYFSTIRVLEDDEKPNLFVDPTLVETITAMTIVGLYGDYADVWSVCASIDGQSRGDARTILQTIMENPNLEMIDLYVLYSNPYWNRALGLYTSLGYVDPETVSSGRSMSTFPEEALKLTWVRDNSYDKSSAREKANRLRTKFYTDQGFTVNKLEFPIEHLKQLEQIAANQSREYGGGIGVVKVKGGKNTTTYRTVNISDPKIGTFIPQGVAMASVSNPDTNYSYFFHTHPDKIIDILDVITAPPSTADVSNMYIWLFYGTYKQFVVESEMTGGVWTIQINPYVAFDQCKNASEKSAVDTFNKLSEELDKVNTIFFETLQKIRQQTPDGSIRRASLSDINFIRNGLVNQYIQNVNSVRDPKTNIPYFLIEYHAWDYLNRLDTFVDWTIVSPNMGACGEKGVLASEAGLKFGFPYPDLKKLMDAIDEVGDSDYSECVLQNPGETTERLRQSGKCRDRWDGQDLIPVLRAANIIGVDESVQKILDGGMPDLELIEKLESGVQSSDVDEDLTTEPYDDQFETALSILDN